MYKAMMRLKQQLSLTILACIISPFTSTAQEVSKYQIPINLSVPSSALKDTETVELILPREFDTGRNTTYPVLFVFDKQNRSIYKNTLQSIDYLTAVMQMPPCIIVGISYADNISRSKRTLPGYRSKGGQADAALSFLLDELYPVLVKNYKAANFKLFIGHSRTAIFSGYAINKRPRDINGIIASSTSYFDFGQEPEKVIFDQSLDTLTLLNRKSFYFFSVGDSLAGDAGHAGSVVMLDNYFRKIKTPPNLIWKSYFHTGASHITTPGLTVPQALNSIFDRYMETQQRLFKKPFTTDTITLLNYIDQEYAEVSAYYGYKIQPDIVLYNSLASHYKYNAEALGEKRFAIARFIWEKGTIHYPYFEPFYTSIANLWLQQNNTGLYREYLIKALACVDKTPYYSKEEQVISRNDLIQQLVNIK
jgi:enterochelin esterase-like enzyme